MPVTDDQPQIPEHLRPARLSNGEMDHCAATRGDVRCAWRRHFGHTHSFGKGSSVE